MIYQTGMIRHTGFGVLVVLKNEKVVNLTSLGGWTSIGQLMTSRTRLTRLPMSGDILTDWFYRQIVTFLRKDTLLVLRKRRLRDPDDKDRIFGVVQKYPGGVDEFNQHVRKIALALFGEATRLSLEQSAKKSVSSEETKLVGWRTSVELQHLRG